MTTLVTRTAIILEPDQTRVLLRPFSPGSPQRIAGILARILAIPEEDVGPLLEQICTEFSQRHENIAQLFQARFDKVKECLWAEAEWSAQRQLLAGSYFLAEYSLESAALFNPSIVPHPCQEGVPPGGLRFILSLRATGEGRSMIRLLPRFVREKVAEGRMRE